ncbi:MAG TPA: hypothetical protein VF883_14000 [Thermoanaerobaculia bacterium]|jgi:hypothetical protein
MTSTHPTADQLERYRSRALAPAELLDVDAHIATCDRCFDAVRADTHLTYEDAEAYVNRRADRERVQRHIVLCELCRSEVADLTQMRDAMRRPRVPVRWAMAAAALLAFVLVAAWLVRRGTPAAIPQAQTTPAAPVTPPVETTRAPEEAPRQIALARPPILDDLLSEDRVLRGGGTSRAFSLQSPVGTVVLDDRPRFHWAATTDARSYAVVVADTQSSAIAASGSSGTASWRPATPLPRGRTYAWQVTAHTGLESIVSPGLSAPEARFHVATREVVAEVEAAKTHFERGVVLAERGVLDDAERELEQAASEGEKQAPTLLEQVRSWRSEVDYLVLPSTTNGTQ